MDFKENKAIYLQIADYIANKILCAEWLENERVPSVREMAVELSVNPNTCMRAYEHLTRLEIIVSTRGIGYFVADGAKSKLLDIAKLEFFKERLPMIFLQMQNLNISISDVVAEYEKFCNRA